MIVVGVRVTRISTDGCAVRVQFVVGLHSVPYLFNSNFYQLTLRASNDRVLFFLCPRIGAGESCTSRGCLRRCKHLRCVITRCSYVAGLHGETAQCGCTSWLHGEVTQCGRVAWPRCVPAVLLRRIVPGALSTGVIHSVENLRPCDLVERNRGSPRAQFKSSAEKFL